MNIDKWVARIISNRSVRTVAIDAGITQTTLQRQVNSGDFSPQTLIALARANNKNVLEALVIAGFLTQEEAADGLTVALARALESADDLQLLGEIQRRLKSLPPSGTIYDIPIMDVDTSSVTDDTEIFLDEYGLVAHPGFEEGDGETVSAP